MKYIHMYILHIHNKNENFKTFENKAFIFLFYSKFNGDYEFEIKNSFEFDPKN